MAPSLATQILRHNFWHEKEPSTKIDVQCMLPNGMCISFPLIPADMPLSKIKSQLWEEAARYGIFRLLLPKETYVFVVVSSKGGTEEILDEDRSLYDIRPVKPYLKVVQRQGDEDEKKVNNSISRILGRTLTSVKSEEVDEFRRECKTFCENISYKRGRSSWERRAIYTYPPEFEVDQELTPMLQKKLQLTGNRLHLAISMKKSSVVEATINTIEVASECLPSYVIRLTLQKRAQAMKKPDTEQSEDYILKVVGKLDFLLGEVVVSGNSEEYYEKSIIQYKYIQHCVIWDKKIRLVIVPKHELDVERIRAPTMDSAPPPPPKKGQSMYKNKLNLWNLVSTTMFKIKVTGAMNVNAGQMFKEVQCGLFHGGEEICAIKATSRQKGIHPNWNEYLEFELPVSNLPRMVRLCFCIIGYKDNKGRTKPVPIAWVNTQVFDYNGTLHTGLCRLYCWPSAANMNSKNSEAAHFLNPLGTVSSSGNEKGPCIHIEFMKFANTVVYPPDDFVFEYAAKSIEGNDNPYLLKGGKQHHIQIEEIIKKDVLVLLGKEEKELLWRLRADCSHDYPQSLPKLLECVKWHCKEDVAQIHFLLQSWRQDLEVEIALDLLDYKFPDIKVRTLAVKILDNLQDGELEMYLLQLVQALKYESYLGSALAKYLLRRALNNRRIGHYLFWHLKADVSNPECTLQFSLLLEMYCRGAANHIPILLKQVEAINKMKTVTEILQSFKDNDNENKLKLMRDCFRGPSYLKAFSDLISPLDPRLHLKNLVVDKCKYMNSKKKPLWLVFENADEGGDHCMIMFKNGDDLRQDMLTLLSLRLMDKVWKKSGLDYGIIPYNCLSTGPMVGLIEVVPESETLGRIQAKRGAFRGVWNEQTLYAWMKGKSNENQDKLDWFIENFMLSVVGYSIATYVLGVGDRHNDNIMMKEDTGQLFHIDFGHFLGNFKSKLGIKRERVKFVLTSDILYAISKSRNFSPEENLERYKDMCIEAFKVLRSKGNLFITVFAMLLSTGIPELKHPSDLDYLRDSLALKSNEPDSILHFEASFKEANQNKTSTTMNWMFHNINHYWIG